MSTGVVIKDVKYLQDRSCTSSPDATGENEDGFESGDVVIGVGDAKRANRTRMSHYYSFSLNEAVAHGALSCWFEKRGVLEQVVGLCAMAHSVRNESATTFFLSLTQALETLNARFFDSDVKSFVKRIDQIIKDFSVGDDQLDWLIDSGQRSARKIYLKKQA